MRNSYAVYLCMYFGRGTFLLIFFTTIILVPTDNIYIQKSDNNNSVPTLTLIVVMHGRETIDICATHIYTIRQITFKYGRILTTTRGIFGKK